MDSFVVFSQISVYINYVNQQLPLVLVLGRQENGWKICSCLRSVRMLK